MRLKSKSKDKITKELTRAEQGKRQKVQAFGIAAVIGILLVVALFALESAILNKEDTVNAYVLTQDVSDGTQITEDNVDSYFLQREIQISLVPEGYITDKADLVGRFFNHDYKANEVITESGLDDRMNVYLNSIEDPVDISFSLNDLGSVVSGTLREGDYINMYGLQQTEVVRESPDGQVSYYADTVQELRVSQSYTFEHIMITKVFNSSGAAISTEDEVGASTLFNVTISEKDAQKFAEMLANCTVRLAKVEYLEDEPYVGFVEQQEEEAEEEMPITPEATDNNNVMGDFEGGVLGSQTGIVEGDTVPVGGTLGSQAEDGTVEGEEAVTGESTADNGVTDDIAVNDEGAPVKDASTADEAEAIDGEVTEEVTAE